MEKQYSLRTGDSLKPEIYEKKFSSFEEAYDFMCESYVKSKAEGSAPKMWSIWETTISNWNGSSNTMTREVWR